MKTPDIKHNPHPRMGYELTLTIHDAPGPFDSVEGYAYYEVTNKKCSPEDPISGTWGQRPITSIPVALTQVSENVYAGTVYLDLLQDEDYFGLGVCHWEFGTAGASLRINHVSFTPGTSSAKIATGESETTYFAKEIYRRPSVQDLSTGGVALSDWVAKQPGNFFSTTLTSRKRFE